MTRKASAPPTKVVTSYRVNPLPDEPTHRVVSIEHLTPDQLPPDGWQAWVDRLARHAGLESRDAVAFALEAYAESVGFTEPPPER